MRLHYSASISDALRNQLTRKAERLGGVVVRGTDEGFTHLVTLAPSKGDPKTGFRKSIASLLALAAGETRAFEWSLIVAPFYSEQEMNCHLKTVLSC